MKVKEKTVKLIMICFAISILLLSGCTEEKKPTDENNETPNEEPLSVELYPNVTNYTIPYDSFWDDVDLDSSYSKNLYLSNSSIDDIIDWYFEFYDLDKWHLKKTTIVASDPENPGIVTLGEVKLQHIDKTNGVFIIIKIINESMPADAVSMIGIAIGPWGQIEKCGYSNDLSSYEFGYYESLSDGSIEFNRLPLDESAYTAINPLGNLDPKSGHTFPIDYGSFWLNTSDGYESLNNVYAPADGIIIDITFVDEVDYDDYNITIAHTNTFWSYIEHLSEIDESIIEKTGQLEPGVNHFDFNPIEISIGQIIGKAGGTGGTQKSVNWRILDQDKILNYSNPDRYGKYIHSAHFLEYYEPSLQSTLLEKIGSGPPNNYTRTEEPKWGKVDYYENNTIIGNWFLEDVNESHPLSECSKHLSFVYDMWDPSQIRIGVGGYLNITATVYAVEGNSPDLKDISVGDVIVYLLRGTEELGESSITATLLLDFASKEQIIVEGFPGHLPNLTNQNYTKDLGIYIR